MVKFAFLQTFIALLVTCLAASGALAQDRPDLLDVDDEAYIAAQASLPDNVNYSYAYAGAEEYDSISASGLVQGSVSSTSAVVNWHIFEPDSVKRKSNGLALKQGNYLGLAIYIDDGGIPVSFSTSSVDGCKGAMKVRGPDTDNTEAKWKVSCDLEEAGAQLGLNEAQLQTLMNIFGNKLNFKGSGAVEF